VSKITEVALIAVLAVMLWRERRGARSPEAAGAGAGAVEG
jgi:hypothetical protein